MSIVARVSVTNAAAQALLDEAASGVVDYTILNTDATHTVELVESPSAAFGSGFPLVPGAAWSGRVLSTEKLWAITNVSTPVSVAVIGTGLPS